jgi:hypothetical protein
MRAKKIISVFLVLVLSIQLLPLKQTICWLIRNSVSEEIVHAGDSGKVNPGPDELHKQVPGWPEFTLPPSSIDSPGSIHHDAVALIARHADDIPTPPPNC